MNSKIRLRITTSLIVIFCFSNLNLSAQKESNIWFFGNGAGLSFNSSKPRVLTNSSLFTEEGSSVICDQNGKLLFYTNGVDVWDRDHRKMTNGIGLAGGISSTQSCIIVPAPGISSQYYIFTVDEKAGSNGFSYSIVDMTKRLNKGNVTIKNRFLVGPVSEKLTATPHANGKDYWIIVHKWYSNAFYAYLLTKNGLEKYPVISKIGSYHKDVGSDNKGESIGQIKISPNGKKLASAVCYIPNNSVELFDFNNKTGKLSNLVKIPTSGFAYGVEFSPDNTKLYVSFLEGNVGVMQYDLSATNLFDSGTILTKTIKGKTIGALQLGPDNNIYVAKTGRYIDAILHPNEKGKACGYKLGRVNLGDRFCVYGLPNIVRFHDSSPPKLVDSKKNIPSKKQLSGEPLCSDYVELDAGKEGMVYLWSTGERSQKIIVKRTGNYWVKISKADNIQSESINFMVNKGEPKIDLGKDTTLFCVNSFPLNAKNRGFEYQWSTKENSQKIDVDITGTYSVTVTNGECWARDSIFVEIASYPPKFKCLPSFSPGNGSFNSFFDFSIKDVDSFELEVFSPKNKSLWKTTNTKEKWDGKDKKGAPYENGIYSWKIQYKSPCTGEELIEEKGTVKLY